MKFWTKTVLAILPALILLGCETSGEVEDAADSGVMSSKTMDDSSSSATTSGVGSDDAASGESMGMGDKGGSFSGDPLDDPSSLLAKRVIYFDYDKTGVRSDYRDVIKAHAEYLAGHSNVSITLEGHADERGTREYNIALGEQRANAVQRMLTLQGVSASQVRVVSYGEERPAALGHEDDAWALNRRAEFIYSR
ncbi:MAG: peptidoglycan-associated lipoprotein Pal [Ectothiorhodospiraceae bacterium]|nr:peptidoglycan-associated lipoprotein Pal [Ectothiorhodospiraceae bacterium]